MLEGNVLITGGAGFLGRAIIARAHNEAWPCRFTVYSRDEMKQWDLRHHFPDVRCVLGDIARDMERLIAAFSGHDTVIHAGAVKFIPEAEHNVLETVEVNVEGSRNVAVAAIAAGVGRVVGISTDKAVCPINLYGATKMVMERMFAECNRLGRTDFVTVRYGNVVGSTGSVIPIFRRQLQEAGRIQITDPRMTRFWLGVDEAIDLILWALERAHDWRGRTFIGACPALSIVDIAQAVYQLWCEDERRGFAPTDVPIDLIGIRPGEKLHESLFDMQEASRVQLVHFVPPYREGGAAEGFVMAPATERGDVPREVGYSSDQPVRWLGIDEKAGLIRQAEAI